MLRVQVAQTPESQGFGNETPGSHGLLPTANSGA